MKTKRIYGKCDEEGIDQIPNKRSFITLRPQKGTNQAKSI